MNRFVFLYVFVIVKSAPHCAHMLAASLQTQVISLLYGG